MTTLPPGIAEKALASLAALYDRLAEIDAQTRAIDWKLFDPLPATTDEEGWAARRAETERLTKFAAALIIQRRDVTEEIRRRTA